MAPRNIQSYQERVAGAYRAAWVLKLLAWLTAVVGIVWLAGTAIGYFIGAISGEVALTAIMGAALGTILTGGTAYASATNLGIAGARLEVAVSAADSNEPGKAIDMRL